MLLPVGLQSDELKARLEKLRETQERKEYAELVRDVAPPTKDDSPEPFSSYKDQIGFGIYVHSQRALFAQILFLPKFLWTT